MDGIPQAIAASPACKAFFVNLMTQPGETTHFRASDHAAALLKHCGRTRGRLIDVCVVNTRPFSARALEHYRAHAAQPVEGDVEELERMGIKVVTADLLRLEQPRGAGEDSPRLIGGGRRGDRAGAAHGSGPTGTPNAAQTGFMTTSVAILAAGLGTRMRSKRAKVLHRAAGLALVEHVVGAARSLAAPESTIVVTGHQAAEVEALLQPAGVKFVRQEPPRGTGHALECCRATLERPEGLLAQELLMVLYGDTPLLSAATLERLREEQTNSGAAATLITTTLDDPSGYGRVIVNAYGNVEAIVEHKDCDAEQRSIRIINSGIYCFRADLLWRHLGEIQPNPVTGEYYLTDMARILTRHGHAVRALHIEDPAELLGINTRVELADADRILRQRKARELMLSGVTIERPETVCYRRVRQRRRRHRDRAVYPSAGADPHRRGLPHRSGGHS